MLNKDTFDIQFKRLLCLLYVFPGIPGIVLFCFVLWAFSVSDNQFIRFYDSWMHKVKKNIDKKVICFVKRKTGDFLLYRHIPNDLNNYAICEILILISPVAYINSPVS